MNLIKSDLVEIRAFCWLAYAFLTVCHFAKKMALREVPYKYHSLLS